MGIGLRLSIEINGVKKAVGGDKINCSGVTHGNSFRENTPIPKLKIAYTESTALASLYFKVKFLKPLA